MGNSRAAAGRKQRPRQAPAPAALAGSPLPWPGSVGQEGHRLQGADLEGFAAADVGAGQLFVASYHVRLRLGELGAVALVGAAGQLGPLAPDDPGDLVLARLPALGTGQRVGALLGRLVEVVAFFHGLPSLHPGNKAPSPRTACLTSWRRKPVAGNPVSYTPATKACRWGLLGFPTPATKACRREPRVLHPSDKGLLLGTAGLSHP